MKKILLTTAAAFYLMLAFFITQLNAQAQPVFTGTAGQRTMVGPPMVQATGPSISMDFKDASLKDILKVLSMQAGMNFIASEAVQDRKVTLYLDKVPLAQAIDKIFSANNLSY